MYCHTYQKYTKSLKMSTYAGHAVMVPLKAEHKISAGHQPISGHLSNLKVITQNVTQSVLPFRTIDRESFMGGV